MRSKRLSRYRFAYFRRGAPAARRECNADAASRDDAVGIAQRRKCRGFDFSGDVARQREVHNALARRFFESEVNGAADVSMVDCLAEVTTAGSMGSIRNLWHTSSDHRYDHLIVVAGHPIGATSAKKGEAVTPVSQAEGEFFKGNPNAARNALIVVAIGWAPLLMLSFLQSSVLHGAGIGAIASDFGVNARFLIAAPLLVLAERVCTPRLGAIGRHFGDAGLVPEHERERFDAAVRSTGGLLNSPVATIVIVVVAYAIVLGLAQATPIGEAPAWHQPDPASARGYSPAGWWHVLVSLPLLIALILSWLWRLVLWTRFLWLMAGLDLRLTPAHPDHAAGLQFVGHSLRAYAVIAFALGTITAGQVANAVVHRSASLDDFAFAIAGLLAVISLAFIMPLLVFVGTLLQQKRRGVLEYGALADRMGRRFERKWLASDDRSRQDALSAPDFSATIDLYSIVSHVYEMRPVPIDTQSFAILVAALLVPFLPVILMEIPVSTLVSVLRKLML